jgi:DNA primase
LHLMAPLDRRIDHDQARAHAKQIAQRLAASARDRYTLSSAPEKRAGRIFIDYLRNGRATTAIGAWSPRARAGLPIAAPVSWRQVEDAFVGTPLRWITRPTDSPRQVACFSRRQHVRGIADPFSGHIDEFRIARIQRPDGWIETTWKNMSNPGAFAVAGAKEQEGGEPLPMGGAGAVVCLMA